VKQSQASLLAPWLHQKIHCSSLDYYKLLHTKIQTNGSFEEMIENGCSITAKNYF